VNEDFRKQFGEVDVVPQDVAVFCDAATCTLVEVDQSFRDVYCLHHQGNYDGDTKHV